MDNTTHRGPLESALVTVCMLNPTSLSEERETCSIIVFTFALAQEDAQLNIFIKQLIFMQNGNKCIH